MNYSNQYNKLIQNAQNRVCSPDVRYQVHHIKPASMCRVSQRYGIRDNYVWDVNADDTSNLVRLTPREHYIAHLLLAKLYTQMTYTIVRWRSHSKNSKAFDSVMRQLSQHQQQLWQDNKHNFTGLNDKRIDNGTHNFLKRSDGSSVSSDTQQSRIQNGTFHFQGESGTEIAIKRNKQMIANGTHISVNKEAKAKFNKTRRARVESGNWHTCGVKPWNNNSTKEYSKMIYASANDMYHVWLDLQCGSRRIATLLEHNWSTTHDHIIKLFRDGWIPSLDLDWLSFQSSYGE